MQETMSRLPAGVTVSFDVWLRKDPKRHRTVQARSPANAKKRLLRSFGDPFTLHELDAVRRDTP